jgi:rRNA maturation endonuclease Nob1
MAEYPDDNISEEEPDRLQCLECGATFVGDDSICPECGSTLIRDTLNDDTLTELQF